MPPTAPTTPTTTPDAKRDAILDAALTLFSERTFDGTPVPLIADAAGVAAGTIYRYFPSKEALVNVLYRRCKGEMHRITSDGIAAASNAREQFGAIWRGLWRFAIASPRGVSFCETHHHAAYLDAESRALGERFAAETTAFLRQAQAAGAIRDDVEPAVLIALVMGAFTGLVKRAGPDGLRDDADLIATTEDLMWCALKPLPTA